MNGPPYDVGGAAAYALVATVWAIVAADSWRFRLASRPRNPLYRLLPPFTTAMVCFYGLYAFVALLLPRQWSERAPRWFELTDVALLASLALFRHLTWHARLDAPPPSRAWLALTYGLGGASRYGERSPRWSRCRQSSSRWRSTASSCRSTSWASSGSACVTCGGPSARDGGAGPPP
jgi:hypothetical protein